MPSREDPGFVAFVAEMAKGECLCAEIAEADRPCLTCEANAFPLPVANEPTKEDR